MECNHDETKDVKINRAFDVQLKKNLNERKTKHFNKSQNDEDSFKKFPNFEALTKEEKLEFFESLSFARRNVERTGTQTRKRFNTIHDGYLEHFESSQGAVTGESKCNTPSASSLGTQATYTLSSVQGDLEIQKVMSRKSFLSLPENVTLDDMAQADESLDFYLIPSNNGEEPTTSESFSALQSSDEKFLSPRVCTPFSKHETITDADQENVNLYKKRKTKNSEKNLDGELLQMSEIKNRKELATETWNEKTFAKKEHEIVVAGSMPNPEFPRSVSRSAFVGEKSSNEKIKKIKSTLKFEALNCEEKKLFFSILKEAHDNVYKKNTEKDVSPYENILKRYEMDGAPHVNILTSITERGGSKTQLKEKNLRVKLTLTSTDNERLEKAVVSREKIETAKYLKEAVDQQEFLEEHRPVQYSSDKVHKTQAINGKDKRGNYSTSTDSKSQKIGESLDYEANNRSLDEAIAEKNTTLEKMSSIADGMRKKTFADDVFGSLEMNDITKKNNNDLESLKSSKISINVTEENYWANPDDEDVVVRPKTSFPNLKEDEKCLEDDDDVCLGSENILDSNSESELERKNDAERSAESISRIRSPTNSCDECFQMKNSAEEFPERKFLAEISGTEKEEVVSIGKEERKIKNNILDKSSLLLSKKISIFEPASSFESSFAKSHSLKQINEKTKEITESTSTLSGLGGMSQKMESQGENHHQEDGAEDFQFQLIDEECHSKAQHLFEDDTDDQTIEHKTTKVQASLTSPEVFLKIQNTDKKENENERQSMMVPGVPRSISDSEIRQNTKFKGTGESDFSVAQKNFKGSESNLILTNTSDSDSASTDESEEDPFMVPMFVKRKRLPTTKIRVLQDLLKERAKFVEGSTGEFKIVQVPNKGIESSETPTARLYVEEEEEDARSEKKIKSLFLKALAKFCRCGKKDVGEEENMLENLKGEAVAVDVSKSTKSPASVTLNESTMEVLKAAERKKIIQKYWKIS